MWIQGNYVETNLVKVLRRAVLLLAVSVLLFYLRGEEFRWCSVVSNISTLFRGLFIVQERELQPQIIVTKYQCPLRFYLHIQGVLDLNRKDHV